MREIIGYCCYDTEGAERIAETVVLEKGAEGESRETLFRSPHGAWFIHFADPAGEDIWPLPPERAFHYLVETAGEAAARSHFDLPEARVRRMLSERQGIAALLRLGRRASVLARGASPRTSRAAPSAA